MKIQRENGSAGLSVILAVASLFGAFIYTQNTSKQTTDKIKQAQRSQSSERAQINNISDLSIARSLLNSSKGSGDYEPSIYPTNYFSESWNLRTNNGRASANVSAGQNNFTLSSFSSTEKSSASALKLLGRKAEQSQLEQMTSNKRLTLLKLNRDSLHYHYVRSVDVIAKNKIALSDGKTTEVQSIGRIELRPPEPKSARLEISKAGTNSWSTNFGSAGSPLPAGSYKLRLVVDGVVFYGEISSSAGAKIILGLKDDEITHSANNIKASNVVLGYSDDIQFGENKVETKEVNETKTEAATPSGTVTMNAGNCSFDLSGSAGSGGSNSTTSGGSTTSSTTSTTSTVVDPLKLTVKIYRVDGTESPVSREETLYIESTITTKTTTNTTSVAATSSGGGGSQCRDRCPQDRDTMNNDLFLDILDKSAVANDASGFDLYRSLQSSLLPAPGGAICGNLKLVGQYVAQQLGYSRPMDLKIDNSKWGAYGQIVNSTTAENLEQLYAYIPPACARQLIGTRDGCGCFAENTRIRMGDGSERMASEIRAGDVVWNPKTQRGHAVKRVIAGPEALPLYTLTVAGKTVQVTSEHPFLTKQGLRAANQLLVGDIIVDNDGENVVESIRKDERPAEAEDPVVWNFELEGQADDDHYVLANGVMTGDLYLQIKLKKQDAGLH